MLRTSPFSSLLRASLAIIVAIALFIAVGSSAQATGLRLSQLAHKSWRIGDGSLPYSRAVTYAAD
jgi:hypothetical protein